MMKNTWSVGRWIFIVFLACLIGGATLSYSGFCFKESHYLSNDEIIDSAIKYFLDNQNLGRILSKVNLTETYSSDRAIFYKNKSDFLFTNKNCCFLTNKIGVTEISYIPFVEKLLGRIRAFVIINYKAKYYSAEGKEEYMPAIATLSITNCGRVWSANDY